MEHGHLIALKDAPILSHDTLSVVAYWAQDVRMSAFQDFFQWPRVKPAPSPLDFKAKAEPVKANVLTVNRVFALGPVQVWQMADPIDPEDLHLAFWDLRFRRAPGPFLNDPVRVRTACLTLLNARDYRLSAMAEDEIGRLANHLAVAAGRPPARYKETTP